MAKIYLNDDSYIKNRWTLLGETDIAKFLGDPVRTGVVYLHNQNSPILEEITDRTSREQFEGFYQGCRHLATNYGLATFFAPGTTHIRALGSDKSGYVMLQLTDMVVELDRFQSNRVNLTANPLKMSSEGRVYRIDGTFDEVLDELRKGYRFVGPSEGQGPMTWKIGIQDEVTQQRAAKITDEFIEYVNRLYFGTFYGTRPVTKEEMLEHFKRFRI